MTTPYLTKYERARILGTRALQIRYVPPLFFRLLLFPLEGETHAASPREQYERASPRTARGRNRSTGNRDERVEGEEDSAGGETVFAWYVSPSFAFFAQGKVQEVLVGSTVLMTHIRRWKFRRLESVRVDQHRGIIGLLAVLQEGAGWSVVIIIIVLSVQRNAIGRAGRTTGCGRADWSSSDYTERGVLWGRRCRLHTNRLHIAFQGP